MGEFDGLIYYVVNSCACLLIDWCNVTGVAQHAVKVHQSWDKWDPLHIATDPVGYVIKIRRPLTPSLPAPARRCVGFRSLAASSPTITKGKDVVEWSNGGLDTLRKSESISLSASYIRPCSLRILQTSMLRSSVISEFHDLTYPCTTYCWLKQGVCVSLLKL